jgi:methylmalonyl-CoA mutase, C-terminal domain
MSQRKVRILMAKFGEGYETAMMRLARVFSEAGFEVIYTELQDPAAIVASAIQESVDHIGITTLPGAHLDSFRDVVRLLEEQEASNIRITAGGFLSEEDIPKIQEMGVAECFPRGTSYEELIEWSKEHIQPWE